MATRIRRGPRQRLSGASPELDSSESLRTFRSLTDGLSNRLDLPSVEAMRAGVVNNPISLMRRFLVAMRSAGLPKERAQRVVVWLQHEVDARWPMDATPRRVLTERAIAAECESRLAELRYESERTAIAMRENIDRKTRELTLEMLELAALEREMEAL